MFLNCIFHLQQLEKEKKSLANELERAKKKRLADLIAEKDNQICLFGDNVGCVNLPGIGGISTGLLLLGLGLGILCGCYGSRCCDILKCCLPCCKQNKSADLQAPEDYQDINDVNITIDDGNDPVREEEEKQDDDDPVCEEEKQDLKDDSIEV